MLERIDELGTEYGPELSHLSGQTRELIQSAAALERRGVALTARAGTAAARGKGLLTELNELAPQLERLRAQYKAANLSPYQLVGDGVYRYFPAKEAKIVRELRQVSNNNFVRLLEEMRGTAFAGDFSPIAGIQVPIGAFGAPDLAARHIIETVGTSAQARDFLHVFRAQTLADAVATDMTGWKDFAFYSGRAIESGTPQEFAGGLLRYIPGFSKANEGMYSVVIKHSKDFYDKQLGILAKSGLTDEAAKAVSADIATKLYPLWNPRRLGLSPARAALIRSMPTSVSFIVQPAALISEASSGLIKMGLKQTMTSQERLAVRTMLTMTASVMAMSISSAVLSAKARGTDPWEAVKKVINPASGQFLAVVMGERYIPLGGPFRGIFKAVWPRKVDWAPVPVPFANIVQFAWNRINPALKTQLQVFQNKDWYGNRIVPKGAKFPEALLRIVAFEIEGMSPLVLGTTISGIRRGLPAGEIAEEAGAQFGGTNIGRETPWQKFNAWMDQNGYPKYETMNYVSKQVVRDQAPPEIQQAMEGRDVELAAQGNMYAQNNIDQRNLDTSRIIREAEILRQFSSNDPEENPWLFTQEGKKRSALALFQQLWRYGSGDNFSSIQDDIRSRKDQARKGNLRDEATQEYERPGDDEPLAQALHDYWAVTEKAMTEADNFRADIWGQEYEKLEKTWTREQKAYIKEYKELREHAPGIAELMAIAEIQSARTPQQLTNSQMQEKLRGIVKKYGAAWEALRPDAKQGAPEEPQWRFIESAAKQSQKQRELVPVP